MYSMSVLKILSLTFKTQIFFNSATKRIIKQLPNKTYAYMHKYAKIQNFAN